MQSVKQAHAFHLLDHELRTNTAEENVGFHGDQSPVNTHDTNDQLEFPPQKEPVDFQSFPVFKTAKMDIDVLYGARPLPPYCHNFGYFSIQKEGSRVGESTRSGMIEKPAESPYEELSFSVFVNGGGGEQEPRLEEEQATKVAEILQKCTRINSKGKTEHNKSRISKQHQRSLLSRSDSTESGRFLLKVFYPASLVPKVPKSNSARMASLSPRNLNGKESHGGAKSSSDGGFGSRNLRRSKSSDSINCPSMSKSCMHLGSRKSWSDESTSGVYLRRKTTKADDRTNSTSKSRSSAESNSIPGMLYSNRSSRRTKAQAQKGCFFF